MRRVVITGIGMVSPLGANVLSTWENLLNGKSGVKIIDSFDVSDLPVKIGAQVPLGDQSESFFDFKRWVNVKDRKKNENFIIFGIYVSLFRGPLTTGVQ